MQLTATHTPYTHSGNETALYTTPCPTKKPPRKYWRRRLSGDKPDDHQLQELRAPARAAVEPGQAVSAEEPRAVHQAERGVPGAVPPDARPPPVAAQGQAV
eukprot:5617866-Pyramimonas_sp.AAC.3